MSDNATDPINPWCFESTIARMGEEDQMNRLHHIPEQILRTLREADRILGELSDLVELSKHLEISEESYH
jgi:hypothetical protein